jgi:hypothetical protein
LWAEHLGAVAVLVELVADDLLQHLVGHGGHATEGVMRVRPGRGRVLFVETSILDGQSYKRRREYL